MNQHVVDYMYRQLQRNAQAQCLDGCRIWLTAITLETTGRLHFMR